MHVTIDFIKQTVAHKNLSKNYIPMSAETPLFPVSVPLTVSVSYMCVTEL